MRYLCAPLVMALLCGACDQAPRPRQQTQGLSSATGWSRLLSPSQVALEPSGPERLAQGPTAVAVAPDGAALVLDRRGERVLRVTPRQLQVVVGAALDAMDLAAAADGAFALYSPLRARVWVHGPEGQLLGELRVPRILRAVRGVALGASRQVWLQDAHQQRYLLGGPSETRPLEALLRGQLPGEYALANGDGVQARVTPAGEPELHVVHPSTKRTRLIRVHRLPGAALAARVVGTSGPLACVLIERRAATKIFTVQRDVICIDAVTGATALKVKLPAPGVYQPRRELALGGTPPRLAHIHPEGQGLRVSVWPVGEGVSVQFGGVGGRRTK